MKDWLDTAEYPFESKYFSLGEHQLHFIDEGVGEIVLFVHGTPSWSFDFRNVIKDLKSTFRCIAIDHLGFGLSDKPRDYDYSTQNHSWTLEKFVLENQFNNITLVVHDFGGPIGLNFAIRHPDRIKRLVILNSWLWSSENDPEFIKMSRILKSPLLPFLYRYLNFSPRYILPKSFGDRKLSRDLLKQFTKPFGNKYERNGTLAFARSLVHDQDWFEELWKQTNEISNIPTLFIWGMQDPIIQPRYLEKFQTGFPRSTTKKLPQSGHFPQEEQPGEVARAIRNFIENQAI